MNYGFGNNGGGNTQYCSVSKESKIRHKSESGDETYSFLEGYLTNIEADQDEYKNEKNEVIRFEFRQLEDGKINYDSRILLTCGRHTTFTRNVLNRLINIDGQIGHVRLTPYIFTAGDKEITCGAVRHNEEKIKGKYSKEDVPQPEIIKTKSGKELVDTDAANEWWDALIPKIKANLKYSNVHTEQATSQKTVAEDTDDDNDEVPF